MRHLGQAALCELTDAHRAAHGHSLIVQATITVTYEISKCTCSIELPLSWGHGSKRRVRQTSAVVWPFSPEDMASHSTADDTPDSVTDPYPIIMLWMIFCLN